MSPQANQPSPPPARGGYSHDSNMGDQNLTAIFKTTCGAAFRCKKACEGDVEKLYCRQCLNEKRHIMEGRPSKDQTLADRGIIDMNNDTAALTAGAESFPADLKCATKTAPISVRNCEENNKLSHLSQTLDVTCATKILFNQNEVECGEWHKLSELPEHYQRDHRTLPPAAPMSLQQIKRHREQCGRATFFWDIGNCRQHFKDAVDGKTTSFYSPDFYSPQGYRLCLRLFPNGDGIAKGESVSLFLAVMKGANDHALEWPFQQLVSFDVMGEGGQVLLHDAFMSDPNSSSFAKPATTMNRAIGIPHFFALHSAKNMLVNDHLFIRVRVGDHLTDLPRSNDIKSRLERLKMILM